MYRNFLHSIFDPLDTYPLTVPISMFYNTGGCKMMTFSLFLPLLISKLALFCNDFFYFVTILFLVSAFP